MRNPLLKSLLLALPITLGSLSARGATYTNNLNADPSTEINIRAPSVWRATGSHDGSGYISVTDDVGGVQGAIVLPAIDPDGMGGSLPVSAFNFKAKIRIGGGTARPADGMSFSWVENADPLVGAGTVGEEGATTGLVVSLDTWDNRDGGTGLAGDGPAMDIKVNNTIIAHKRFAGDGSKGGYQVGYCSPVETNAAGAMSLETDPAGTADPGVFADIEISLNKAGAITVIYKGTEIYKDVPTGYTPRGGRWVIGARTGGAWDNHWIDDIVVVTDTSDAIPRVSSSAPSAAGGRDQPENSPIQFVIDGSASFEQVDQASIRLTVNGSDVTTSSGTMIAHDPGTSTTTITYTSPTNYAPSQRVEGVLTYRTGGAAPVTATARKTFFVTPVTAVGHLNAPSLFIEAEDFNYTDGTTPGQFFDFGSPAGAYNMLAAQHDVDYHLSASNADSPQYRVLAPPNGIVTIGDTARATNTITPDYKLGWNDSGDWYNYTRTFPNATYKIYGRFSSGGADTHSQLSKVTGATTSNQTATVLGTFDDTTTGGWDSFCFIPLRSAGGGEVITRLNGLTTLRITVQPGNYDFGYMAFVPTFSPPLRPIVTSVSPQGESLRRPTLLVNITDQDTAVNPSSIRLFANGVQLTGVNVTDTAGGADASYQYPTNLPYGSNITVSVVFTDTDPAPVTQTNTFSFNVGPLKGGGETLFIEAEDFNYSDDGVTGGLHIGFATTNCALLGKDAIKGVDYDEGNDGNDQAVYRAPTGVEGGKPGTDGFQRADTNVVCNYIVGWNDPGDWYNYTRDFGATTSRFNVIARMSSGGNPESAEFARITSDPAQPGQTKEVVGQFNSPATGNWDIFHYVPLRDASGNWISLKVAGTNTFRLSHNPGANFDVNYIAFVKDDRQFYSPILFSVEPAANSSYARAPRVTAVIADQDSKVVASSLRLFINGTDVTSTATVTDTATGAQIAFQLPEAAVGTPYTARVEWRDDQTTPVSGQFTWSWTSGIYNAESNLFIEVEDFNTGSGIAFPSFNGVPFNAKGLYNNTNAVTDVDFHDSGNPEADVYRIGETPNIGMAILGDAFRTGAGPRPGFDTVQDYKIGWTDSAGGAGGDWYNYTRDFGAGGNYNVHLRISHGDGAATMGGRLDLLDDPVAPTSTNNLGNFRAPATGGWDTFAFLPLRTSSGTIAPPVQLSGVKTLRYVVEAGGGDINYLMFVPAAPVGPALSITRSGNNVTVQWGQGTLQSAAEITGPWTPVAGATGGSYTTAVASGDKRFYRSVTP